MTNEKPDNNSGWISQLDELECSQDEAFNKETSWNKLHERLHSRPNKRKAIWYWLAAACLFFTLFLSLFMLHKKENVLVKNILQSKKSDSALVQHTPINKLDTTLIISSLPVKNYLTGHSIHKIKETTATNHPKITVKEISRNRNEEITREVSNSIVTPVDTVVSLVANVPGKKKLKVVHINELGDPVSASPNIARYNEQHSFEFKFMNQEVYTRSSSTLAKSGLRIFATKNFATN
ncbi:MAG: hypothetical protein ABI358_09505 [Ginsengibacter sp.]